MAGGMAFGLGAFVSLSGVEEGLLGWSSRSHGECVAQLVPHGTQQCQAAHGQTAEMIQWIAEKVTAWLVPLWPHGAPPCQANCYAGVAGRLRRIAGGEREMWRSSKNAGARQAGEYEAPRSYLQEGCVDACEVHACSEAVLGLWPSEGWSEWADWHQDQGGLSTNPIRPTLSCSAAVAFSDTSSLSLHWPNSTSSSRCARSVPCDAYVHSAISRPRLHWSERMIGGVLAQKACGCNGWPEPWQTGTQLQRATLQGHTCLTCIVLTHALSPTTSASSCLRWCLQQKRIPSSWGRSKSMKNNTGLSCC